MRRMRQAGQSDSGYGTAARRTRGQVRPPVAVHRQLPQELVRPRTVPVRLVRGRNENAQLSGSSIELLQPCMQVDAGLLRRHLSS